MPKRRPPSFIVYACLILCLSIWGGTSVVSKVTIEQFPVFTTLLLRFCLASLFLIPFFIKDSQRRSLKKISEVKIWQLIALGFVGITIQIGFFFVGIASASVLDASIIIALAPLMICAAGWIFLKEFKTTTNILGLSLATFGVMIALTTHGTATHHSFWGNIGILISTIAVAVYAIGSKKLNHNFSPIAITTVSFIVGMISFLPLAAWEYLQDPNLFSHFNAQVAWGIIYLSLASSVIAYWLYEWALEFATAHKVGVLTFVQPLAGIILAVIFLNESIHWAYSLGAGLAVIGIWLALKQPGGRSAAQSMPAKQALHARHPHK